MKVLLAEDDPRTRKALAEILEGEGYEVKGSPDGSAALDEFERFCPDIVCLDIMMPGMSGYAVCKEIRRQNSECGILFISAKSEEMDTVLGLELGADDFIVKPFGKMAVIARIRAVTRRVLASRRATTDNPADEPFKMHDLKVDPCELRAFRDGEKIELGPRDISILRLLHRRRGKAVSRDEMLAECWGFEFLPNSRCLDQHISQLRKRVESDPRQPAIIRTVHGVGYRFEEGG